MVSSADRHLLSLIESLVEEELQTEALRGGFDLNYFKTLTHPDTMMEYAHEHLKRLGQGSSRIVYALSSGKVLKIAYDMIDAGIVQNETEVDVSTNPHTKPVVAKVFDADEGYCWIISELVKPLDGDKSDVNSVTGLPNATFAQLLKYTLDSGLSFDEAVEHLQDSYGAYTGNSWRIMARKALESFNRPLCEKLITGIREMQMSFGFDITDIIYRAEHFGKTADGRIVILDYGYNDQAVGRFYSGSGTANSFWDVDRDHIPNKRYRRARRPN